MSRPKKLDRSVVMAMHESGLSKVDIAKELGVTRAAIYQIINRYNENRKKNAEAKKRRLEAVATAEASILPIGKV